MDDIIFLPLDVPPLADKQEIIGKFNSDRRYVWWDEQLLVGNKDYDKPLGYPEPPNDCAADFPALMKHVEMHLPFDWLSYFRLARAVKPVGLHVDDNYVNPPFPHHKAITQDLKQHHLDNEPMGYRVIISGSRNTFYFCKQYDPEYKTQIEQPKHYVTIPDATDFFLIRNYQQPHGVDTNDQDADRIVGFLLGHLNVDKHRDLIARSMARFGDHALRALP